eukprot:1600825-Pleurochrysis_carterae.AAC.1
MNGMQRRCAASESHEGPGSPFWADPNPPLVAPLVADANGLPMKRSSLNEEPCAHNNVCVLWQRCSCRWLGRDLPAAAGGGHSQNSNVRLRPDAPRMILASVWSPSKVEGSSTGEATRWTLSKELALPAPAIACARCRRGPLCCCDEDRRGPPAAAQSKAVANCSAREPPATASTRARARR